MKNYNLYQLLFKPNPKLRANLRMAHMDIDPKLFIRRNLISALYLSLGFTLMLFFIFSKNRTSLFPLLIAFPLTFMVFYLFFMGTPQVYISRRQREIDREILFATRYLLIKIDSGVPLFNAMIDASKAYGVGGKYFKEIVDEINLGTPIEDAIEQAQKFSPSRQFKLVMRQIENSIKTGVDVSKSLKNLLDEITREQQIEVKAYSKKLNSIILFYLIIACVIPSMGIAMFLILASILNLNLSGSNLFVILFFVGVLQVFFIFVIRSIRPTVDL
ncbi:MAG: type II secretion system F family protein [Candidatus Woesearchaeota archaeon]